jgi:transcriptional regulator with XRE-family HTH domain
MAGHPKATKVSNSIGLRIKKLCLKNYKNKSECARAFGVSPQKWTQIEAGRVSFDQDEIYQFAAFFGVDPGWLLTGNVEAGKVGAAPAPGAGPETGGDLVGGELLRQYYAVLTRLAGLSRHILDPSRREDVEALIAILESAGYGFLEVSDEADIDQDVG